MRRLGDVMVLDLSAALMVGPTLIRPVALVGPDHTLTLVDAGRPDMPGAAPDLPRAHASVRRLAQEDVQTTVTYHGSPGSDAARGQLRAQAASLT